MMPRDDGGVDLFIEPSKRMGDLTVDPPPEVLERVSRYVEETPAASRKAVREQCSGDNEANGEAVDVLVRDGYLRCVERQHGSSTWRNYTSLVPFRAEENGVAEEN